MEQNYQINNVYEERPKENLLKETIDVLAMYNLTPADVVFITDGKNSCYWPQFEEVAKTFNYDSGYGAEEVNVDLKIVGTNWWLERDGYDGAEGWEFKTLPIDPNIHGPVILSSEYYRA